MLFLVETIQRDSAISFPMFGDFSVNPPSYFTVFGKNIYFYGVIISIAFLIGIFFCTKNCGKFGLKEDDVYDVLIWMIPLSIVGARLYFVLFNLDYYLANPSEIIAVWEGGLAIYGGIIAGILVIFLVCRRKRISVAAMLDLLIIACILGQAIGRWGNFMNREAFGCETDVFCRMGLTTPAGDTIFVHPTFLYESVWNLAGFIFLCIFVNSGKRRYDGQCLLIYFVWYGLGRFWIEGLRTDSLYVGSTGIRASQLLSALLVVFGAVMLAVKSRKTAVTENSNESQQNPDN